MERGATYHFGIGFDLETGIRRHRDSVAGDLRRVDVSRVVRVEEVVDVSISSSVLHSQRVP